MLENKQKSTLGGEFNANSDIIQSGEKILM
jgi:hypothetical protein